MSSSSESYFLRRDVVVRRATLEISGHTLTPLRVGMPSEGSWFSNVMVVLKDSEGRPYIPGTSWKGLVRSASELVAQSYGIHVCAGFKIKEPPADRTMLLREPCKFEPEDESPEGLINAASKLCLNCRVFGTTSFSSMATFYDSEIKGYSLEVKPSIHILSEGRGQRTKFFRVEHVAPGAEFTLRVDLRNPSNYALGYMVLALDMIHRGRVQVGAQKSRGYGRVEFDRARLVIGHITPASGSGGHLNPLDGLDRHADLAGSALEDEWEGLVRSLGPLFDALKAAAPGLDVRKGEEESPRMTPRNMASLIMEPLTLTLEVLSESLHVGEGRSFFSEAYPGTVFQFYRIGGELAIPGSTLKGLVRARLKGMRVKYEVINDLLGVIGDRVSWASRAVFYPMKKVKGDTGLVNVMGGEYEVVKKGSVFRGEIGGRLEKWELGLILMALGYNGSSFNQIKLGRFKNKPGFGLVRFGVEDQARASEAYQEALKRGGWRA